MKSASTILLSFLAGFFILIACEPQPSNEALFKDMVVQTNFDNTADFSAYATYTMPLDTIGQIYNAAPNDTIITGTFGSLISRQVKTNLDHAGYSHVSPGQNPDLAINVYVIRDFSVFQSISYGGYGGYGYGYPGYYYPGYYGYGGYYGYPYVNTYVSNTGTLVIEMIDLKNKDAQGNVKAVWIALAGDVISSLDRNKKSVEAVDQAFAQSPYMKSAE